MQGAYWDQDHGDFSTWTISGGNRFDTWKIDTYTGRVTVNLAAQLNFEPLSLIAIPEFNLALTITDQGGLSGTGSVSVNVIDVNELPSITTASVTVREEQTAVGALVGSAINVFDEDFGQAHVITIKSGDPTGIFGFVGYQMIVAKPLSALGFHGLALNYEAQSTYNLMLTVTDSGVPPLSTTSAFQVRAVWACGWRSLVCAARRRRRPPPLQLPA